MLSLTTTLGLLALLSGVLASPQPISIQIQARKSPKGYVSGCKRAHSSAISVPLDDWFLNTDLQWFGNISVGTPPQDVSVVFDTGSDTLEFVSTACTFCSQTNKFDLSKSVTFVQGNRTATLDFATGASVDPVVNDNYVLTLRNATDTVTVGGSAVPNVSLWTIINQTDKFNLDPFSGIQGLSSSADGFFLGLVNQGLPSLFSMFLTPKMVGHAELLLGGIDNRKFRDIGPLVYADQIGDGDWEVNSTSISVNGRTTSVLDTPRSIIFDSGTSNILFSTSTTEAMYALISPDIKPFEAEPGAYGLPCSKIHRLPAVIDITFMSQNGHPFKLTIPSSELNVRPFESDPSICQTLINAFDGLSLVGGSLLKHYYSVWDIGNQRMGFAPNSELFDYYKIYVRM